MTSVEEKKQISEDVETVNSEAEKGITLNDIVALRNIVNIASRRGAFGAEEFKDIGTVYNRIDAFVKENVKTKEVEGDTAEATQPEVTETSQ